MSKKKNLRGGPFPLDSKTLETISDRVHESSIRTLTGGVYASKANMIISPDGSLQDADLYAAPLMAFAAAQILHSMALQAHVVAGAAIWSVGSGACDTLDHGIAYRSSPSIAAAAGNYHTWVICEGWLFDFAARTLPAKFARAQAMQPFSTPRERWTRFPEVITHSLANSMPDPLRDPQAPYGYFKRGPELLSEVRRALGGSVAGVEARAEQLAA